MPSSGRYCKFFTHGCRKWFDRSQSAKNQEAHERFCGCDPDKLSERQEDGIKCMHCEHFALDSPLDIENKEENGPNYAYTQNICDAMMQEHCKSKHQNCESECFRCLVPICGSTFYTHTQLQNHMSVCQFKDHVMCQDCGYFEPPWRTAYHTCKVVPEFPKFDENTKMETLVDFFGAANAEELQIHVRNPHVIRAAYTLLNPGSTTLMGSASRMKEEFQQLMAAAFVLFCIPGAAIVHCVGEPTYANPSNPYYKDSVDEYGFLLDLKGFKAQVNMWLSVAQEHNQSVPLHERPGKLIPEELFHDLLAKPSTVTMWNAALEIYTLATVRLSYKERDCVCLMKQEVSGHSRGGDGFGQAATLSKEECSLTPDPMVVRSSPHRLKIQLPSGWQFPEGSIIHGQQCDSGGNVAEGTPWELVLLPTTCTPGSVITIDDVKRQLGDDIRGHRFIRLCQFLNKGDEFDYGFDGATLRVVVQQNITKLDEPFVVPLPINFSHVHTLLHVGVQEGIDTAEAIKKDIGQHLVNNFALSFKSGGHRSCTIFKVTDLSFVLRYLQNTVGYFTKLGSGDDKMDAKLYRQFSSENGLKTTSMLVHKVKILDYLAPLMLVPPATDSSKTYFHQSQPSQEIRNGLEAMMSAFRQLMAKIPANAVDLAREHAHEDADRPADRPQYQRFLMPLRDLPSSLLSHDWGSSDSEDDRDGEAPAAAAHHGSADGAGGGDDRAPILVPGAGVSTGRNRIYRCCFQDLGCGKTDRLDVMREHITRCGYCPDDRSDWIESTFGAELSVESLSCIVQDCNWVLNDRRVENAREAMFKVATHARQVHQVGEEPVQLANTENGLCYACGYANCRYHNDGKNPKKDVRVHMMTCGYDQTTNIEVRRTQVDGKGVCKEPGCTFVVKTIFDSKSATRYQSMKTRMGQHKKSDHQS